MNQLREQLKRLFSRDRLYQTTSLHINEQQGVPASLVNDANKLFNENYRIQASTPREAAEKLADMLAADATVYAEHYAQYSAAAIQEWDRATKNGGLWEDTIIGGYRTKEELKEALQVLPTQTKRQLH